LGCRSTHAFVPVQPPATAAPLHCLQQQQQQQLITAVPRCCRLLYMQQPHQMHAGLLAIPTAAATELDIILLGAAEACSGRGDKASSSLFRFHTSTTHHSPYSIQHEPPADTLSPCIVGYAGCQTSLCVPATASHGQLKTAGGSQ
jgi:hypothetical protein